MQRYVGQLKRKALVYRQSIKGSFRRRKQNTTERPLTGQQVSQTSRRKRLQKQKNLNFNEELTASYSCSQEQKAEIIDNNECQIKNKGVSRSVSNELHYQGKTFNQKLSII